MANKNCLSKEELELLKFIIENQNELGNTFTPHDVSCLGYIASSTYYKNLYDKGFLNKPEKGKFAINEAAIEDTSSKGILWWILIGWWWMPLKWLIFMPMKWMFYTFPKWVLSIIHKVIHVHNEKSISKE